MGIKADNLGRDLSAVREWKGTEDQYLSAREKFHIVKATHTGRLDKVVLERRIQRSIRVHTDQAPYVLPVVFIEIARGDHPAVRQCEDLLNVFTDKGRCIEPSVKRRVDNLRPRRQKGDQTKQHDPDHLGSDVCESR